MNKKTKILLIIAFSLILSGCIIFGGVMTMLKWDFKKLSTNKYETNTYHIDKNYSNIVIETSTADIKIIPTNEEISSVICYEQNNEPHSVSVIDDTLVIKIKDTKKWYENIGINFETPKITVYLSEKEYNELKINVSTGDIEISEDFTFNNIDVSTSTGNITNRASTMENIKLKTSTGKIHSENITANTLDLSVTTGKIKLYKVTCNTLKSFGNTGDVELENVVVAERLNIERSTGDITFKDSDAGEIFIETDTGDVKGNLLSEKIFVTETNTGTINVPESTTGGKCEIITDTGDIIITYL